MGGLDAVQIRQAKAADAEAVAAMWHAGWHVAHGAVVAPDLVRLRTPAEFAARTRAHLDQCFVGEVAGEIAGFFMLMEDEVYQFYVGPEHRGSGMAAALMAGAEARLTGRLAWLACSVGNDRAAAFYAKCGWVHVRTGPYTVETSDGPRVVQEWRFEKQL